MKKERRSIMLINEIKFVLQNSATLTIKDASLKNAVRIALNGSDNEKYIPPILVLFPSTGKQLYFDRNLFEAFTRNEINQQELIENTQIEGLYRNKYNIAVSKTAIDKLSLWKMVNNKLILIDDDCFVESDFDSSIFQKVE